MKQLKKVLLCHLQKEIHKVVDCLKSGLQAQNIEVDLCDINQMHSDDDLKKIVDQTKPDICLMTNMSYVACFTYPRGLTLNFNQYSIPLFVVIGDLPQRYLNIFKEAYLDTHHYFIMDSDAVNIMKELGFPNTYHLNEFANEPYFYPRKEPSEFSHPISFGGTFEDFDQEIAKFKMLLPPNLFLMMKHLINQKRQNPGQYLDVFQTLRPLFESEFGPDSIYSMAFHYISNSLMFILKVLGRQHILDQLANHEVHIYGPGSWQPKHPKHIRHRALDRFTELPFLYSQSAINLCETQFATKVHKRVFESLGCQSFILHEQKIDLESCFEINKEIITYRNTSELPDLVDYYLAHPKERQEIADAGHTRVMNSHCFSHRVPELQQVYQSIK